MIDQQDAERALDWLMANAAKAAQARAEREHLDEYRRVLRARLMRDAGDVPVAVQERQAMGDPQYAAHLEALKVAIEADERYRWLRSAAELKISLFQSLARMKNV